MEERRQQPRRRTDLTVEIYDRNGDRYLGRLADLSSDGFMLCGAQVPRADSVLECRLVPRPPLHEVGEIRLGADCLWSRGGQDGQLGWAGFHIIDIAEDQAAALDALMALL